MLPPTETPFLHHELLSSDELFDRVAGSLTLEKCSPSCSELLQFFVRDEPNANYFEELVIDRHTLMRLLGCKSTQFLKGPLCVAPTRQTELLALWRWTLPKARLIVDLSCGVLVATLHAGNIQNATDGGPDPCP